MAYLAAVFRKLDWRLLPVFFMLNMLNYLDRANLAFASINMSQDLGLTSEGAGRMFWRSFICVSVHCPCQHCGQRIQSTLCAVVRPKARINHLMRQERTSSTCAAH